MTLTLRPWHWIASGEPSREGGQDTDAGWRHGSHLAVIESRSTRPCRYPYRYPYTHHPIIQLHGEWKQALALIDLEVLKEEGVMTSQGDSPVQGCHVRHYGAVHAGLDAGMDGSIPSMPDRLAAQVGVTRVERRVGGGG